jgi:RND family efflux transporter MFP subunit
MSSRSSGRGLFTALISAALILAVLGVLTVMRRQSSTQMLAQETERLTVPTVAVIHPTSEPSAEELVLPGTLQAFVESPIYARTSGYLSKWYRDIGSKVKRGDLLAEIDAPELDQELSQAKATRDQIAANAALAATTADRWVALRKSDAVSQQDVDEKQGALRQLQASLAAANANVRRLEELEQFKRINAPFDGVITRRGVDAGTLITAGSTGSQALFHVAQMDPIRVFLTVPEVNAAQIRPGMPAGLEMVQYPGERFAGKVARTAESIDPATRTLLTEVDVPNSDGRLLPGGYAQVHLQVGAGVPRVRVPVNTLLFRAEGLRAVVVDANHQVHLRPLTIGRDYGTSLEVLHGLSTDDWIVLNPPDSLDEGERVQIAQPADPSGKQ